jgi:hypothetical protein
MTWPAPTDFVLWRDPMAHRSVLRRLGFVMAIQTFGVCVQLIASVVLFWLIAVAGVIMLCVALSSIGVLVMYLRMYISHRAMRNLRLIFSVGGVTYTSDAGTFTAAWSAVARVTTRRGGHYLSVRVRRWGGPVSGFGLFGELVMSLAGTGIPLPAIRDAVRYLSNGTVAMR